MQVKEIMPINFMFYRVETTIAQLVNYLMVGQDLIVEAVRHKLAITGPVHWHYFGFEGDESKPFMLEISLPVAEVVDSYDGKFHFKRTDFFKSVSTVHDGPWQNIPTGYEKLMQYISENKLQPIGVNREIYINVDFRFPEANSTEIQVGII